MAQKGSFMGQDIKGLCMIEQHHDMLIYLLTWLSLRSLAEALGMMKHFVLIEQLD